MCSFYFGTEIRVSFIFHSCSSYWERTVICFFSLTNEPKKKIIINNQKNNTAWTSMYIHDDDQYVGLVVVCYVKKKLFSNNNIMCWKVGKLLLNTHSKIWHEQNQSHNQNTHTQNTHTIYCLRIIGIYTGRSNSKH